MHETQIDNRCREGEHEDSCSCSSHPHIVSSSSTEIITVPADLVPLEQGVVDGPFLIEHREWICSMSQADQPGCDDRLFSASRRPLVPGPADLVPLEQNVVDRTFLMERLLLGTQYMGTVNVQQYINRMERIGESPSSDTDLDTAMDTDAATATDTVTGTDAVRYIQYADDIVRAHETAQDSIQDTDSTQIQDTGSTQIQDTNSAQTQETNSDQTPDTAQDTQDTQDTKQRDKHTQL